VGLTIAASIDEALPQLHSRICAALAPQACQQCMHYPDPPTPHFWETPHTTAVPYLRLNHHVRSASPLCMALITSTTPQGKPCRSHRNIFLLNLSGALCGTPWPHTYPSLCPMHVDHSLPCQGAAPPLTHRSQHQRNPDSAEGRYHPVQAPLTRLPLPHINCLSLRYSV
jgi:hypothetical protein